MLQWSRSLFALFLTASGKGKIMPFGSRQSA
jgi:hypothetical protein